MKEWLDEKTSGKWEEQPDVSAAFELIKAEMENVYSVSTKWEGMKTKRGKSEFFIILFYFC